MKPTTLLRSSSALWASPFAVGLALFYYFSATQEILTSEGYGYAPMLVAYPLDPMYAFAYCVAASLGAWESGKLVRGAVWQLAPARSRYRVAAEALLPVVGLCWLMLLLPVGLALAQAATVPTPDSLPPLLLGLVLCSAHAVTGFAAGLRVPQLLAAPVLAVAVWLGVAVSVAGTPFWWRHLAGQYSASLTFGRVAAPSTIIAQLLPTVGIALAAAALWLPVRRLPFRVLLSASLAVGCALGGYAIARDWGPTTPVATRSVQISCAGQAPRVCMPEGAGGDVSRVRAEVTDVLARVESAGIGTPPALITDTLVQRGYPRASAGPTWRVALTRGDREGLLRYRIVRAAVDFGCEFPDPSVSRRVLLWAAERTGETWALEELLDEDPYFTAAQGEELRNEVEGVLARPGAAQTRWYREQTEAACRSGA